MFTDPLTRVGKRGLRWVESIGLIVIGIATVVAGVQEISLMIEHRSVQLADLLLLFIYLEVLTMVGLYLESGQLPVRMPLYIGMVALARYLVLDMKAMDAWHMIGVSASILVLALAVLVVRYGHDRFPYGSSEQDK